MSAGSVGAVQGPSRPLVYDLLLTQGLALYRVAKGMVAKSMAEGVTAQPTQHID
jgi:hypothetical protein